MQSRARFPRNNRSCNEIGVSDGVIIISALLCLILGVAGIWLYRAGRIADTISDAACQDGIGAYSAFAEHFSESTSFALADLGGHQVLLVSHEIFGNNVDSDKEAIAADIFALDDKGMIVSLGSVRSQGTLYPVSILDGKIMVAGHQFVRIYSIRWEELPELVLDSYGEGDGPELDVWFRTFEKGTPVKFSRTLTN